MSPRIPESALVTLLRQCYLTPRCQLGAGRLPQRNAGRIRLFRTASVPRFKRRVDENEDLSTPIHLLDTNGNNSTMFRAQTGSEYTPGAKAPKNIAVLGGGITGMACVTALSKLLPDANITLYEGSNRLGGWLNTKHVNVGNGNIVFEQGPRTLRPTSTAGMVTLTLIKHLGLEDELIITDKNSVAAQNRFLYYPDHLVRMPGPGGEIYQQLWSLLTEPAFKGLFHALWNDPSVPKRPDNLEDESVGSFLTRRLSGSALADNLVSAVLHGIYAGDIYQLSVKSLLPGVWQAEKRYGGLCNLIIGQQRDRGVLTTAADADVRQAMRKDPDAMARWPEMRVASVYSFKKGIGQLSDTMAENMRKNRKVQVKIEHEISKVAYDGATDSMNISTTRNQPPAKFDHVISTISGRKLASIASAPLTTLASTHAVTVMVVNLYYRNPNLLSARGFGYLIPRSVPYEQNPEFALGVIFDSDATIGQDSVSGTKLTVMMGGHWWDELSSYPSEEEGARMARAVLKRHLNIDEEPEVVHVGLQKECIPQYTVGHHARMERAHHELMAEFNGKLSVAGNSYTGVGLNDCVRAGWSLAQALLRLKEGDAGITGLEEFQGETQWVID